LIERLSTIIRETNPHEPDQQHGQSGGDFTPHGTITDATTTPGAVTRGR